jgi:hypothetical protein
MHASLRYYGVNDADAVTRNVRDEFLDIIRDVPGFSAYHVVDLGDGSMVSITLTEDQASAEASAERAAEWIGGNEEMQAAVKGPPRVVSGEITASA